MNLDSEYLDPSKPGSFMGLNKFKNELEKRKIKISNKDVKNYLKQEESYTIHKYIPKKQFRRNKTISYGIDYCWQADLVDMSNLKNYNDDNTFILTVIDVFSRFAFAKIIKNKSAQAVVKAFDEIFKESKRKPLNLMTDKGNEFINKSLKKFFLPYGIKIYTLNSEMKASMIERFNRTLKTKMWKYFTSKQTYKYTNVLDDFIESYNKTIHSSLNKAPFEVNKNNEKLIFQTQYVDKKLPFIKINFKKGDKVRISKDKLIFEKGYTPNYTREIFIIDKVLARNPVVYKIKDLLNEKIDGVFYEQQLQKITKSDNIYYISEILKSRIRNKKKEYYVSWLGYPEKFNSWESEDNFINFKTISNIKNIEKNNKELITFSI